MSQEIYIGSQEICTHSHQANHKFGDWHQTYSFSVDSASLEEIYYGDKFTVDFEINVGDTVYALYMIYNDGDSFGRAEGKGEVIWVFKDFQTAKIAAETWEQNADDYRIKIVLESGKEIELHNCCAGYFERLTEVGIEPLVVNGGSYRKKL